MRCGHSVRLSVSHTRKRRLHGSRYRNTVFVRCIWFLDAKSRIVFSTGVHQKECVKARSPSKAETVPDRVQVSIIL